MKRKTFNKIRRYFFLTLFYFVVAGFFYLLHWFISSDISKINEINISGANPDLKNEELMPKVSQIMTGDKRFFFLPADHIIFYNKNKIVSLINKELPNIESINIKTKGLHTLNIEITSRVPIFNLPAQAGLSDGKVLDKHGIIYTELTGTNTLPFLNFSSVPNEDEIKSMTDFMKRITTRLFEVKSVEITKDKDIYFYNKTEDTNLKYHKGDDTNILWNTFISALDTPPLSDLLQNKKSALEYIDLRFGNKVFYKFREGNKNQIVPDTIVNPYENTNQTSTQGVLAKPNQ